MAFSAPRIFAPLILAPTTTASGLLALDQLKNGLEELAPEKLRAALESAIVAVAKHASTNPDAVRRLLPLSEVDAVLQRLATTQPKAVAAWGGYAGGLGGLLGRASLSPGEGQAPLVSEKIRALAETMQRDKVVAQPLHAVAEDLAAWEALASRLVDIIGASKELRMSYRMRQIRNAAVAATIVAILITIAIISRARWVARSHVLAALAKEDPCEVFALSPEHLDRVSSELQGKVAASRKACEDKRAAEAKRIEEERQRKAREEAERKAREKREADCNTLASHVEAGSLTQGDETFAADGGLTKRIATGTLEALDFGPADPKMPCSDTKAADRMWEVFSKAVLEKPWVLLATNAPAPRVRKALSVDGSKMPFKLRKAIATRANNLAKFAVRSSKKEDATRASAWCDAARKVGMPMAGPCDSADKLVAGK